MTSNETSKLAGSGVVDPVSSGAGELAVSLGVDPERGLSATEAAARLETYGHNRLAEGKHEPAGGRSSASTRTSCSSCSSQPR